MPELNSALSGKENLINQFFRKGSFKIPALLAIWVESDPCTQELSSTVFPSKEFQHSTCKQRENPKTFLKQNSFLFHSEIRNVYIYQMYILYNVPDWSSEPPSGTKLCEPISTYWEAFCVRFDPASPTFTLLCRLLCSSGRIDGRSFSLLNCSRCPELLPSIIWSSQMMEKYEWNVNTTCRQSSWKVFTSPKRLHADTRSDGGSMPFSTWPIKLGCATYLSFQNPEISMDLW